MLNRDDEAFEAFVYAGFSEQIDKLAKVIDARRRLIDQANPKSSKSPPTETTAEVLTGVVAKPEKGKGKAVTVVDRRVIGEADTHVGAGKDKAKQKSIQALTLVELLYNARLIDMNMLMAADRFRTLYLEREGHSVGVGSYGNNPGGSNPAGKSDRSGRRLTGYEVNGEEWRKMGPAHKTNSYDYEAAKLAMCGVVDIEGKRVHDQELVTIMISAIVDTVDIQTQGKVARIRTRYTGEKQLPSAGATVITEALKRITLHLRY